MLGRRHRHRQDHRQHRRERHRAGARAPRQRQHRRERDDGDDDAEDERARPQQIDREGGEDAEQRRGADAMRGARRHVGQVGDARRHRAADRQRRGVRAGDRADRELDAADAAGRGDAVDEIRRQQPPRLQPRGPRQPSISSGSQACTFWRCSPRPAMPRRISSPGLQEHAVGFMPRPTPGGVPVVMRSPGQSVMKRLT